LTCKLKQILKNVNFLGLILLFATLAHGCTDGSGKSSKAGQSSSHSQDKRDDYGGVYFRIQADYEVIETGEPLNFDFIVSCYNREVPGSFHGILKPTTMFKATSNGAAVAISPLKRYCERAVNGFNFVRDDDLMKMPLLAWYPDVTNMSFAFVYMTNDAYTGPRAKVRFKRFDVERSDKTAFLDWEAKALKAYKQIGAIPGPFGCATANVHSGSNPYACASPQNIEKNNGLMLAIANKSVWTKHIDVNDIPLELARALKETNNIESDIYCDFANTTKDGERQRQLIARTEGLSEGSEIRRTSINFIQSLRYSRQTVNQYTDAYLDPEALLSNSKDVPIKEVYPVVNYSHPLFTKSSLKTRVSSKEEVITLGNAGALNNQVLFQEAWRGFAIIARQKPINKFMPEMKPTEYSGEYRGVWFLNDRLICETTRASTSLGFTDFNLNKFYKSN